MKKTILIIGNSQLTFFVSRLLSEQIGDLAHIDITWLTQTNRIFPASTEDFAIKGRLRGVRVISTAVKSISLNDRRVVTGKGIINYDLLFVDQTPVFTAAEIEKITDQFETLISTVRSKENRGMAGKVKVALTSQCSSVYQLALKLASRTMHDSSNAVSAIRVEVEPVPDSKLKDFLTDNHIFIRRSQHPGMTVKAPLPIFPSRKIRGLRVDLSGQAILLATGEPTNHPDVLLIDNPDRLLQNLARADYTLAKQIVQNITAKLEGGLEKPLDQNGEKLVLTGVGSYMKIGRVSSNRHRASAVASLERAFWRRLLG